MKVAVYARVSTEHEEQQSSIENQEQYYLEYCKKKGYDLYKLYTDEGLSATSSKRKEFLEMLYDAGLTINIDPDSREITFKDSDRKPKFELIITKDVTRFARNVNAIDILRRLRHKGVYVLFENMNINTRENDWEMRVSLLLTFAQQESINRSESVSFAYKQRAEKGIFHLARGLYGYKETEDGDYEIFEEEAEVVRRIFDLCVNHDMGGKNIANILNEEGIRTRRGKEWRAVTIRDLLRNEKYKGQVIVNRLKNSGLTFKNTVIERDRSEWKIYDNAMPAIVSEEIFDIAQAKIKKRTQKTKEGNKVGLTRIKNIFHKKIRCMKCGADYIRVSSVRKERGTEYTYICSNRRHFKNCEARTIAHNKILKAFYKVLDELPSRLDINIVREKEISEQAINLLQERKKEITNTKSEINKKITDVEDQKDKLFDFIFGASELTKQAIQKKLEELEHQLNELQIELTKWNESYIDNQIEKIKQGYKDAIKFSKKRSFTFSEVLEMTRYIQINDEGKHRIVEINVGVPTILVYALSIRDGFYTSDHEYTENHERNLEFKIKV